MKANLLILILLTSSTMVMSQSLVEKRFKKQAPDLELYDAKLGDWHFDGKLKLGIGYDDNSTSASLSSRQEEGGYFTSGLDLALYNQFTQDFSIDTNFYVGYKWWTSGDNQDELIFNTSGDTLAFDWDLNEKTKLSFIDRFRMNTSTVQELADGEGSNELRLMTNDAAIQLFHEINEDNEFGIKVGYTTRDELTGDFDFLDRDDLYAGLLFSHLLSQKTKLGVFLNGFRYDWDENINNDGKEWQIGLSVDHAITNLILLKTTLGWQDLHFEDDRAGSVDADEEGHGLFGGFAINHIVSEKFWHNFAVDFRRRISSDNRVNFSEVLTFTYGATWNVNSDLYINPSIVYIYTDKQNNIGVENGLFRPTFTIGYDITSKMNVEVTYIFTNNDSDTHDIDYNRNQIMMNLTYDF